MSAVKTNMVQQSQGFLSCSLKMKIEEESVLTQKQGIVTILGCDTEKNTASASSLRRTLSADMSSKKWLPPKGSSPMEKIASSEQLLDPKTIAGSFSSSSEEDYEENKDLEAEAERERLEIWSSIQRNKKEEQEKEPAGSIDTWSSIISMKSNDEISKSLPVYIHPLVKRSKSCSLSEKSLEICTESLGSETGSDGVFSPSSYPSSETGETEEEEQQQQEAEQEEDEKVTEPEEEELLPRYNNYAVSAATTKKSPPRSFPPPLPSLSHQTGPSLHMRPHRDNGRLVLEAVTLPSLNNFSVQRQDGRLVLTFANPQEEPMEEEDAEYMEEEENEIDYVEELKEEFAGFEEDDDDVDQEEEKEDEDEEYDVGDSDGEETEEVGEYESDVRDVVMEKGLKFSSGVASVKRLALMVNNKPIGLVNRNPNWSEKFNDVVNFENVNVVEASPCQIAQSLPPRPRVARLIPSKTALASASASASAAASLNFNAYEQYWRTTKSSTNGATTNPLAQEDKNYNSNKLIASNENQQVLVLRGKNGDYLVHNLKSCKDSRRSFLFWEPYCIATS